MELFAFDVQISIWRASLSEFNLTFKQKREFLSHANLSNHGNKMQLKTILNHVTDYKSFVFGKAELVANSSGRLTIEVQVSPRKNGQRICSGCEKPAPGYDTSKNPRRFNFVPIYGAVVFIYFMRRVNCRECGIKVETIPWADGNSPTTKELSCFLAKWAKHMSWREIAKIFHVSWDCVVLAAANGGERV